MKSHPNEVIVIHFNHNAQNGYHANISESLEKGLLKYWETGTSGNLAMNNQYKTRSKWPTLRDAISSNKIIFIFMDYKLRKYMSKPYDWLVGTNGIIASTWDNNPVTSSCSAITTLRKNVTSLLLSLTLLDSRAMACVLGIWHDSVPSG